MSIDIGVINHEAATPKKLSVRYHKMTSVIFGLAFLRRKSS